MDELELLKKDWQKEDSKYPKLSYNEIYNMILKKSSSIVKWIFIISLLEFALWTLISFGLKDTENMQRFKAYDVEHILIPISVIGYIILAYFFYLFFKNYKTISAADSAKNLMENILRTRRTVKYYVGFNLIYLVVATIAVLFIEFDKNPELIDQLNEAAASGEVFKFYAVFIITIFVVLAIFVLLLLLFYYLIYGLLLRRLNKNYREIRRLEL